MYITGSGVLVSGEILTCIAPGGRFYLSHRKRYVSVSVFRAIEETRRSSLVFTDSTRIGQLAGSFPADTL